MLESVLKEVRSGNPDANRPSGEIAIKRIYGDWTTNNMNGWKGDLLTHGVRPAQQFRYDNNATDGALMMDAIEIIHSNPRINAFCIVSSDSDFYNLALRIREYGLYVLGIGHHEITKEVFRKSCNDFVFTNNLPTDQSSSVKNIERLDSKNRQDSKEEDMVKVFLIDAFNSISSSDEDWISLSKLGNAIKNEDPGFDPRTYGHKNLLSLINSYNCFSTQSDASTPPNYSINLSGGKINANSKFEGVIKKFIYYYGFIEHESGDYYFHVSNVAEGSRSIQIKKGQKVLFNVFKLPNPEVTSTDEKNGKASEVEIVTE